MEKKVVQAKKKEQLCFNNNKKNLYLCAHIPSGHKRALDPLELELGAFVSLSAGVVRSELQFTGIKQQWLLTHLSKAPKSFFCCGKCSIEEYCGPNFSKLLLHFY